MLNIGPYELPSQVLLAPMAGVSDAPFRQICQAMGAGLTTSEMLTAQTGLWHTRKSSLRLVELGQSSEFCKLFDSNSIKQLPRSVQIAGSDAEMMAEAAKQCVALGAEIVDINMGCPAKKVCNKAAGSALLRDEKLVTDILTAVFNAVTVPVTLKIRTGWCQSSRNGTRIARIAEESGISALTVHGRTRACRFTGEAEYETIAAIVETVDIPVIANGDIDSPQKAQQVLNSTGANAVMIGRAIQGQPWLIREVNHFLQFQQYCTPPTLVEVLKIVSEHLNALYNFYGDYTGVRIARKHIKWYSQRLITLLNNNVVSNDVIDNNVKSSNGQGDRSNSQHKDHSSDSMAGDLQVFISAFNTIESPDQQQASVQTLFERLITKEDIAA